MLRSPVRPLRLFLIAPAVLGFLLRSGFAADAGYLQPNTDPDHSWPAPLAAESLLLDIAAAGHRYVVVGERGHVLVADKHSLNWKQVLVPTRTTLTAVAFYDGQTGLAVGHDAVVLRTTDGGLNWQRVHAAPEEERPLLDVHFRDGTHVAAIGAYGYYLESNDGGLSWTSRVLQSRILAGNGSAADVELGEDLGDDFHLNRIAESETGRSYIAAEAGTVYRSDDHGETWSRLPSPYEGSFFGVLPLNDDNVLLFGLRGRVFRSSDAGLHWHRIETGTDVTLTSGVRLSDGTVVLAGSSGVVLVSDDNGNRFFLRQLPTRAGITAVLEGENGDLIAVGEDGVRRLPRNQIFGGFQS